MLNKAIAQQPYAIQYNQATGMPSDAVYSMLQDSKGFLWIGGDEGLTRYDGYEYITYKCDAQASMAGSCVKEDRYGRIWYENFDGRLYYIWQDSLHALSQHAAFNYYPYGITDNYLMVTQQYGIDVYNLETLEFLKTISLSSTDFIESSAGNQNEFYWIQGDVLYKLNNNLQLSQTDALAGKDEKSKQVYVAENLCFVISKANDRERLYLFDRNLAFRDIISIKGPQVIQGANYIDKKFWLHTAKGTFVYPYNEKDTSPSLRFFKEQSMSMLLKDRQNNYWFSTTSAGIWMIPDLKQQFFPTPGYCPSKIVKTSSGLWLADKSARFLKFGGLNPKTVVAPSCASPLYYLYADSINDNIIYSAKGMSILPHFDPLRNIEKDIALKEIVRLDTQYYAFAANGYCALMRAPDYKNGANSVWDKLYLSDSLRFKGYARICSNMRGRTIAYDPEKHIIYCSGNKGFFRITPEKQDTITFNGSPFYASKIALWQNNIFALNTKGSLYLIDSAKQFSLLNPRFGIPEFDIKYIRQFNNSLILLSRNLIHLIDLDNLEHHILDIKISPSQINDLYFVDSNIYLLLNNGVLTAKLRFNDKRISSGLFRINNLILNGENIRSFQNALFSYKQNDVSINFSLLDFGSVQLAPVYYKVNNEEWKLIPNESRSLQFRALKSGSYDISFRLGEEKIVEKISFAIDSPFWYKWWFLLICFTIFAIAGYLYYKWQIGILSRQIKLLREKVALEQSLGKSILTSIKSQMNPHFFYNALNTIQAYIFTNDRRRANMYLSKFSKLTRLILEMSEKELIKLREEIEALTLYLELEKMRFEDDFTFVIQTDQSVDMEMIRIPSMLIQPYVENAVKHGLLHLKGDKKISIYVTRENQYLKVAVEDNGIGRIKSNEMKKYKSPNHQSFSTKANEQRLEILNRNKEKKVVVEIIDKNDENNQPGGTTVYLFIPLI